MKYLILPISLFLTGCYQEPITSNTSIDMCKMREMYVECLKTIKSADSSLDPGLHHEQMISSCIDGARKLSVRNRAYIQLGCAGS